MDIVYCENKPKIRQFLKDIKNIAKIFVNNKKIKYYDILASFDIETSSFYRKNSVNYTIDEVINLNDKEREKYEKIAIMYVWQFCIKNYHNEDYLYIYGRTWKEYIELMYIIHDELELEGTRLIVWVHNLQYEYQFIRKLFTWVNIFATEERAPLYALNDLNIEYRCSYRLSDYPLEKIADNLLNHKIKKLVGNVDYNLIRNSKTPLTDKELAYNKNDVLIVIYYIEEQIEQYNTIINIPLTKTGKVRKFVKEVIDTSKYKDNYRNIINRLTYTKDEYTLLKRAFMGGYTHANVNHVGDIMYNVRSFDETSAYPYMMITKKYPMSKGIRINITSKDQFYKFINAYCCVFDIRFFNVTPKNNFENYLSSSKCACKGAKFNNGRIISAEEVSTTITEIDYKIINKFYNYDSFIIGDFYYYQKGYLPYELIDAILQLYENKTKLKGIKGKEVEYLNSKEMLNSCFGMCVTDIVRDEITYNSILDEWGKIKQDTNFELKKYNHNFNRFLSYAWGVYITAYNREVITNGILEFKEDYVYTDTDSLKVLNYKNHLNYINKYNANCIKEIKKICKWYDIPFTRFKPKTLEGKEKIIGVFEDEGEYSRFKTLGAKRYIHEEGDKLTITISGVNKKKATPYLTSKYGDNVFNAFKDNLVIPPSYTGKLTHTYIDEVKTGYVVDYLGNKAHYLESSAIHLEPVEYSLNIDEDYLRYLLDIKIEETYIKDV